MIDIKYLEKRVAKATIDFTAQKAIDSAYTFDAANIDEAADTITIANHPYKTGDQVGALLTADTGVTATAPALATAYWVIYVDKDTIALATSLALAKAGTKTALTAGAAVDVFLQRGSFGAIGTGIIIPNGAVVTLGAIHVITTLGSRGAGAVDLATIALSLVAANDMVSAISIATGTIWDAGFHGTLVGMGTGADAAQDTAIELAALVATSYLHPTADVELTMTIATDSVDTGKMEIYVEYYV